MGLSQSLYTGWSGMSVHQRALDNLSNNLANVNNSGYRKSDFLFTNLMNQVLSGSMGAGDNHSTVSAKALGLGASTGAILNNFTQGPIENTGNPLDVAINGNGFFLVKTPYGTAMTRSGSFYTDHAVSPNERMLCLGDGLAVQGWTATNGVITPGAQNVGNIYLPADGDLLPGVTTGKVDLKGNLPTNTSSSDFNGRATTDLDLKGNLSGNASLIASIYAPVTRTGSDNNIREEIREIKVEIGFVGPTTPAGGGIDAYSWTMKTVDWPNPGDPAVQIYPPPDNPEFNQDAIRFYTESSANAQRGAGQAVDREINPGSTTVRTSIGDGAGGTIVTSFTIPPEFQLDVSRLTALADAPGGNALEIWSANGSAKGSMARTITVFDEYTGFVSSTDENGNTTMRPQRRVEAREVALSFTRAEPGDGTTAWSWRSSLGDASGTLTFNSIGDLTASTSSGGRPTYNFTEVTYNNSDPTMQAIAQDGYRDGYLEEISIDQNGKIWGRYSNDVTESLAQIAMGMVANPSGLSGTAGNLFYTGPASGNLMIGVPGDGKGPVYEGLAAIGAGGLSTRSLESSNVNLSQEFTSLIGIERGYQLNGKVITTSDEMLQTALQIKR